MRLHVAQYTRLPFIIVVGVLLLVFLVDFMQRVWRPLNPQEVNISQFSENATQVETAFKQPAYLAQWLQGNEQEQDQADVVTNNDSELAAEVVAMPGSTALNNENVRIRAIFISGNKDGNKAGSKAGNKAGNNTTNNTKSKAVAVAEVQNTETGEVSRVLLRTADTISAWKVSLIEVNQVLLTKNNAAEDAAGPPQIALYVFEPIASAQKTDEPTNNGLTHNKKSGSGE
ncbi:hypothetical protein GPUN_2886 [Glaciecola punicea ACAM 611]|uniref:Uncharacterized protein n=1 Tax=Glaciecola punicea ACAM 611 TaxID=1121923 RepID=H5TF73_9ALTE|nr:hypothetical protein [Glaciecola punicea]GAB57000.1 hypothetical protein GPUN_2886 [Glaciecola punicea ACAM 611]